ncbi:hypothetical protein ACFLZJ_00325 [Nanoarchaeota archaeon]
MKNIKDIFKKKSKWETVAMPWVPKSIFGVKEQEEVFQVYPLLGFKGQNSDLKELLDHSRSITQAGNPLTGAQDGTVQVLYDDSGDNIYVAIKGSDPVKVQEAKDKYGLITGNNVPIETPYQGFDDARNNYAERTKNF